MIPVEIFNILNSFRPSTKILNSALKFYVKDKTDQSVEKQAVSEIHASLINGTDAMELDCQEMVKYCKCIYLSMTSHYVILSTNFKHCSDKLSRSSTITLLL